VRWDESALGLGVLLGADLRGRPVVLEVARPGPAEDILCEGDVIRSIKGDSPLHPHYLICSHELRYRSSKSECYSATTGGDLRKKRLSNMSIAHAVVSALGVGTGERSVTLKVEREGALQRVTMVRNAAPLVHHKPRATAGVEDGALEGRFPLMFARAGSTGAFRPGRCGWSAILLS
jgi:hypothetical protein